MPNTTLPFYESIGQVSQLMLAAARDGDWESVCDAEQCAAALIARLQAAGDARFDLDAAGRKRRHEIILQILAEDAEIRDLADPSLRRFAAYLKPVPYGRGGRGAGR